MKTCLIIGYGWLGKPLAAELTREGFQVWATTSKSSKTAEMLQGKINPVLLTNNNGSLQLNQVQNEHFDSVILTFPPFDGVVESIRNLLQNLSFDQLIFTGSTGIYVDKTECINELSEINPAHKVSIMEEMVKKMAPDRFVILRLAGHIGPNRHPVRFFLANPRVIPNGNAPVNLIHQSDIIAAIFSCIRQSVKLKTYNLCWPEHPTKANYYGRCAQKMGGNQLTFSDENVGKTIDGLQITRELSFNYRFSIEDISQLDLKKDNISTNFTS